MATGVNGLMWTPTQIAGRRANDVAGVGAPGAEDHVGRPESTAGDELGSCVEDGSDGWSRRQCGRLDLRYRSRTHVERDIDALALRFSSALAAVTRVLDVDEARLPPIIVTILDQVAEADVPTPTTEATVSGGRVLTLCVVHTLEAPCIVPEVDLLRLLLPVRLGPPTPCARFWDEGLVRYVAGQTGRSPYDAEAADRCRRLLADGVLPPMQELISDADVRMSSVVVTAASAFAEHLVRRFGLPRYIALLRAAREPGLGVEASFARAYHRPLAVTDRDWRRHLEATGRQQYSALATMHRLVPLLSPYWWSGIVILFYAVIGIGFSLALPLTFRFLIDDLLGHRPLARSIPFVGSAGHVIGSGSEQLRILVGLLVVLAALYVVNAVAHLRMVVTLNWVGEAFVLDLRRQLLDVLSRLPATYFARTTTADVNQRVVYDAASIQQALINALVPLLTGGLSIAMNGVVLVALDARLALVALLGLPLLGLLYRRRRRNLRAAARERARRISSLSARVGEITAMQMLIKIYGAGAFFVGRVGRQLQIHRHLNLAYAQESSTLGQSAALIMHLTQVTVLLVGGYLVIASDGRDLGAGGLAAFYVLLSQVFAPVAQVSAARQGLTDAGAAIERVTELLAQVPEQDAGEAVSVEALQQEIRFDAVCFSYAPHGPLVLQGVSLSIRAGETVAFVGPTGAGKSSVVNLLPRLYGPASGQITWDGVDLQCASLASLRSQIALVPQDALLLAMSVYENIRFGLEGVSEADVRRAAELAQAHDFIDALPDGYDTVVGELGAGLSGGQRQRVALARALLRDPSVLILDEATSALDAITQRAVQLALSRRLRDELPPRTVIKIAHRLETVADADAIFVLDGGRLVEQGRHGELLDKDGLYARLVADQLGALADSVRPSAVEAVRWLVRLAPFSELPASTLEQLGRLLVRVEYRPGEEIYARGGAADALYVVGRGQVDILAHDEDGIERVVNTVSSGQVLALASLLRGTPHATTARAASPVVTHRLARAGYETIAAARTDGP